MRVLATPRAIWAVSFPLVVAGLSETVVDVIDTIFLGRYGTTELGAISLADAVCGMLTVAAVGLADGMQIVMARRAGAGGFRAVGQAFNRGLALLAIAALVAFVALRWGSPLLAGASVSSPDVREAVGGYLRVAAAGVFFEAANLAWGVFYLTISRTGVVLAATAVLAAANMLLDWCLIFGKLGAPEMGIRGAAAATVAAQGAAFCFFTIRAICGGDVRRYGLFSFRGGHRAQWRVLLGLSAPVTLEALVETARWFAFFAIIERMGEVALASATIVYCCYSVLLIPAEAFSEASCSMVSNLIGQGSAWRMGPVMRHALSLGYAVTLPLAAASAIFPEQALAIFTADDAAIEGGLGGLLVVAAALLVAVPGELLLGAVVGTGDTRALLIIEAAVTACVLGMTWTIAELRLPAHFAWLAVSAGWILRIALSLSRLRSGAWRALRV